jgi:hypothetical protein
MVKSGSISSAFAANIPLAAFNARLPESAHFGVYAGQHEGVPHADNATECAAETCFTPGHATNRNSKQSTVRNAAAIHGPGSVESDTAGGNSTAEELPEVRRVVGLIGPNPRSSRLPAH